MNLSIIIVNYNTFELTRDTILSVLKNYPFSLEILVVDNDSTDNSLNKLKDYFSTEKNIRFIKSPKNNGFAFGNNIAIKKAMGKYILLLNSDTVVQDNTLEEIYDFMEENPDVGACGCRVLLENGELDKACKRSFPNPKNSFYRLFHIPIENNYNLENLDDNGVYDIDCLTGAFMFIRGAALKDSGLLDETFFMYGEDIDLCYRIKNSNWRIVYYGKVAITHYKGASSKKQKSKLIYEFYRAMYIYYRKHYSNDSNVFMNILVYVGIVILCIIKLILNIFKSKN